MQLKTFALLGLSTAALAANAPQREQHKRQDASSSSSIDVNSVASVLITALPASLLSIAATNTAAVSSIVASEFSASATPSWFSGLPSDVQTYLLGTAAVTASAPIATGNSTAAFNTTTTATALNTTGSSASSTGTRSVLTTAASRSSSASAGGAASSTSSGMAALPTAIIGSGLMGAIGVVGMLAL